MRNHLSPKRRLFIEEYLKTFNATEAARRAGYKHPNKLGPRLVKVGVVQEEIKRRLAEAALEADEVLARLGDQAMADIDDFLEGGEVSLEKARRLGKTHLIKEYYQTDKGIRVKLHDAQAALALVGRHHALFTDKTELTVPDIDRLIRDELAKLASAGKDPASGPAEGTE